MTIMPDSLCFPSSGRFRVALCFIIKHVPCVGREINIGLFVFPSGTGKDKVRGKGSQGHSRIEELGDDAELEKQEQTVLTECRPYLCNIFTHWRPACAPAVPQSSQPTQPSDNRGPSGLDIDTAHLLTKWSLRSLVEGSYDDNRTTDFLQWFHKVVIPHKETVEVVLPDPGLKADLLRLYHQAFQSQSQRSSRLETLHLFTTIMVHLLESQGHPQDDLHQAVRTACLLETAHDQSRKGKRLSSNWTTY